MRFPFKVYFWAFFCCNVSQLEKKKGSLNVTNNMDVRIMPLLAPPGVRPSLIGFGKQPTRLSVLHPPEKWRRGRYLVLL